MIKELMRLPPQQRSISENLPLDSALVSDERIQAGLWLWKIRPSDWDSAMKLARIFDDTHMWVIGADDPGDFYIERQSFISPWSSEEPVAQVPIKKFPQMALGREHAVALTYVRATGAPLYQRIGVINQDIYCAYIRLICPIHEPSGLITKAYSVVFNETSRVVPCPVDQLIASNGD